MTTTKKLRRPSLTKRAIEDLANVTAEAAFRTQGHRDIRSKSVLRGIAWLEQLIAAAEARKQQ